MNNNMIKVLAVVVIAGGLWYFLSGGEEDWYASATKDTCELGPDGKTETDDEKKDNGKWTPEKPASKDADGKDVAAVPGSCEGPKVD